MILLKKFILVICIILSITIIQNEFLKIENSENLTKKNEDHSQNENNKSEFDPEKLFNFFTQCLIESSDNSDYDDISIKEYLLAFEEINKFLSLLGSIFYFVISDIKEKINILNEHLEKEPNNYATLKTLIEFENNIIKQSSHGIKNNPSCSITLLRLHRALIFICKLLKRLSNSHADQTSYQIGKEAYEQTLAKYHPWLIRKAVYLGINGLPRRDILISHMIRTETDKKMFPIFLHTVEKVCNITHSYYKKYDILDL